MADPIKQFKIEPLIPLEIGGMDVSFTNSSLFMMLGILVSVSLLTIASHRREMVPGRIQIMGEMMYEFVANMIRENVGNEGRRYFPFVFTIFVIVLMGNLLGLLPYSFTYTSHIVVTFMLAALIFMVVVVMGIARHGVKFFSLFVPSDVPLWLLPLIIPIELLSFLIRPITLSVRLFANMMAGHLMLKVFAGFSVAMFGAGMVGMLASTLPMLFNVLLITFELLIALLQAYVFAVLTCIYLKDTVDLHH